MGTPDFAVEALQCLVEGGYNVVGVITMPDKPAGRGHKIQYSPVKQYALDHQLPLLQPEKLKDEEFIQALREWKADLQIVVAFRMLPEVVWNMPRLGTFNLHASLLPQYRGAAPIKVYDFIRGLSPYPAAWSELVNPEGEAVVVKIFESEKLPKVHTLAPGSIVTDGKNFLRVAVPDGFVNVLSLQLPGKKRLKTDELLRGFHLTEAFKMKAV